MSPTGTPDYPTPLLLWGFFAGLYSFPISSVS
jgi:hypothetical protein